MPFRTVPRSLLSEQLLSIHRHSCRTYINRLSIGWLVPPGVESPDAAGEISPTAILGFDIVWVLRNAVIYPVDRFDEFLHDKFSAI